MKVAVRLRSIYHGWWVATTGAVSLFLLNGFQSGGSMGLFFVALERHFGWSRTLISGAFSLIRLENSFLGPVEGFLTDRLGPHRMVLIGFMIGALGFLLLASVSHPVHFYVALLVITTGAGIGGLIPVLSAVNWWFNRRRNRAMGITTSAFGFAYALGVPVAWIMALFGWRATAVAIGIVLLIAGFPLSRLLKPRPDLAVQDSPLQEESASSRAQKGEADEQDFTVRQAMRTRAFWIIPLVHASTGFTTSAVSIHGIPHLVDVGLSLKLAASVLAVQGFVEVFWRIFGSAIGDRIDKRYGISVYCAIQASGAVVLALAHTLPATFLFAVLFGIGHGGRGPLLVSIRGEYFGRRSYGAILGIGNFIMSWTGLMTPVLLGYLHDVQGTYAPGFLAMASLTASGSVLILFAKRPRVPAAEPAGYP